MELGTMSIFMSENIAIKRGTNEVFRNFSNVQLYKHLEYLENYDGFDTYFKETYHCGKKPWDSIIIETEVDKKKSKTYIFFSDEENEVNEDGDDVPPFYMYEKEKE